MSDGGYFYVTALVVVAGCVDARTFLMADEPGTEGSGVVGEMPAEAAKPRDVAQLAPPTVVSALAALDHDLLIGFVEEQHAAEPRVLPASFIVATAPAYEQRVLWTGPGPVVAI